MGSALRFFRAAVGEYFFEMPRMVLLNLFWFITAVPFLWVAFVTIFALRDGLRSPWIVFAVQAVVLCTLTLALAGPGTAALYHVMNRVANGELLEPRRFWSAFRRYFWRGWGLALADAGAGALLVLNIWFYWIIDRPWLWLLSIVFAYFLVLWFAIQSYLFALLVEMNQAVRLVVRNALFLAIDNLGLTLGLMLANLVFLSLSVPLVALLLPFATPVISSNINNKAVVDTVRRYRTEGRIISGDGTLSRDE